METKICGKCKTEKDIIEFNKNKTTKDGFQSLCKNCQKEYRLNHKKESNKYYKEYVKRNKKEIQKYHKSYWIEYYNKNKDNRKKICRDYNKTHKKERNKYRNKWRNIKRKEDVLFKFIENIRNCIRNSFKKYNFSKKSNTYKIVGLPYNELKNYLFENAKLRYPDFKPEDFLESNKYHIDHVKPLATAKTEEEVIKLNHYTNLQLLTKEDNLIKHDSLTWRKYEC